MWSDILATVCGVRGVSPEEKENLRKDGLVNKRFYAWSERVGE